MSLVQKWRCVFGLVANSGNWKQNLLWILTYDLKIVAWLRNNAFLQFFLISETALNHLMCLINPACMFCLKTAAYCFDCCAFVVTYFPLFAGCAARASSLCAVQLFHAVASWFIVFFCRSWLTVCCWFSLSLSWRWQWAVRPHSPSTSQFCVISFVFSALFRCIFCDFRVCRGQNVWQQSASQLV